MAEPVHAALVHEEFRVRVYSPVGELVPGIAYLVRRLLENTSNESFVRHRFAEGRELDELIRSPEADAVALDANVVGVHGEPAERRRTDPRAPAPFTNEPHAELRRAAPRAALAPAVRDTTDRLGFTAPLLIDGEAIVTDRALTSVDPGHIERVVCRSGCADAQHADRAVDVAAARVAGMAGVAAGGTRWGAVPGGGTAPRTTSGAGGAGGVRGRQADWRS